MAPDGRRLDDLARSAGLLVAVDALVVNANTESSAVNMKDFESIIIRGFLLTFFGISEVKL